MSSSERTERLLNLLFLLMASGRPVSKAAIRDSIADYQSSPTDDAFERKFERDKEELRSMGVPIQTVEGPDGSGGVLGYRVAPADYALPDVELTGDEMAVLAVAARVWEQASLGPAARTALHKLEATGGPIDHHPAAVAGRVTTAEPSFPAFLAAAQHRRPVRFGYRKPEQTDVEQRTLQPWGVVSRRGHWYVAGFDVDRGQERVFRLSRVVEPVLPAGADGIYAVPADADVSVVLASVGTDAEQVATVRARPGHALDLRRRATSCTDGPGGWDVLTVPYGDDESLALDLVGFGATVVADAPESLRAAVVRRLGAVLGTAS